MANAARDSNNVPTLIGVSSADNKTPVRLRANPTTGALIIDPTSIDSRYVNVDGDAMTGTLTMGTNPIKMVDSSGGNWLLTVNTDGALVTTKVTSPVIGNPLGLGLLFTYSEDQ